MKKGLLSVLAFIVSLQGLNAQGLPTPGGHPEDPPVTHTTHDGSNTLGQSYYRHDVCGLNFVEADTLVETRSNTYGFNANGTGIPSYVNIHGLPTGCDSIVKAFLYWVQSYTAGNGDPASLTVTNPAAANFNYTVNNIGLSVGQNWGDIGTATYRADVTNSISGNGKYNINITGTGNMGAEIDGVSLIIIYRDYAATYTGSITLFDGADAECTSGITLNYTGNGFTTCAASPNAVAFGLFGDMQSNIGTGTNTQTFNGSTATFNNNFWNYDAIPTTLTAGQSSIVYDTYTNDLSDCYVISLLGLYWQNTSCVTCTVGSGKLNLTMTQTPANCGANTGTATVNTTGGTPPYIYSWSGGATTSSITGMPPGWYKVNVKDASCDAGVDSIQILNTSSTSITVSSSNNKCYGGNIGTASVLGITGGVGPYTYTWTPAVSVTSSATGLAAGTYTVAITDAGGCSHDTTFVITQPAKIRDSITSSTNVTCGGLKNGSATVGVGGGVKPYGYLWSSGQTTTVANNLGAGTYTITITDKNGCKSDTTVTITQPTPIRDSISLITNVSCYGGKTGSATVGAKGGTGPYTYLWNNGQATVTATGLITGFYTVTVTDSKGCTDTAIAHITQPAQIRDSITAIVDQICSGSGALGSATVGVTGGTGPYTYFWSNGQSTLTATGLNVGTYTFTVTDANNCTGPPITVKVTSDPPLVVNASPPASVCLGSSAPITATGKGGDGIYTYTWNPGNITGQTITVTPTVTTTYTVTLTDGCSSAPATATVVITVNPQPVIAFTADSLNGCYPLCVNFINGTTIASGTVKTWEWSFGDGDTAMSKNPHYCYSKPGQYTVTLIAISNNGCKQQLFISNMITVYDHPHANFTASPQPATILQPSIQFTDQSVDQYGINQWFWSFGDATDSTSTLQDPSHTYGDTGTFCQTLTVTNIHNCTNSIEKCIVIEPFFALYVPDAFTPNHDGLNDVFMAEGKYICNFEMWIFDRWGMQMYHSTDITKGWNGTVNGDSKQAQEDTYVYLIKAQDCRDGQHQLHSFIGKVTLLR